MELEPLEREAVSLASSYRHERGEVLMGSGEMRFIFKIQCYFQKIIKREMSSRQLEEPETTEVAGFISKTFEILKNEQFGKIIYWAPSGIEFIIKDVNKFQSIVLPRYFRHSKMNSFIRQLNMYGFHKSRADHSKSVFSHPFFIRERDDLLITIKRKIKGKCDLKDDLSLETPVKKRPEVEVQTATTKKVVETGNELTTELHLNDIPNNVSFNLLGTREKLQSLMNLNFTVNKLPLAELGEMEFDENQNDDIASIEDKMDSDENQKELNLKDLGPSSYKFMNPSCFFESMRRPN